MSDLRPTNRPKGKITPDQEQGEPIKLNTGWIVQGFRDEKDRYYERATRGAFERWYRLD
jgi:hypothetical protein